MFESILLESAQQELLSKIVEASRSVPHDKRQAFLLAEAKDGAFLIHPGLPGNESVYVGDVDTLARERLIAVLKGNDSCRFTVTPLGFKYYEEMKRLLGEPHQRVEITVRQHLDSSRFQQKYLPAFQKWAEAENLLWASDSEDQLTTIGHLCREALQEFASVLVEQNPGCEASLNKANTAARIKAVLGLRMGTIRSKEHLFLKALIDYWGTVSDLVQRQEHGGQKEGEPISWEDARRVVFQTAIVMFEVDKSIDR